MLTLGMDVGSVINSERCALFDDQRRATMLAFSTQIELPVSPATINCRMANHPFEA